MPAPKSAAVYLAVVLVDALLAVPAVRALHDRRIRERTREMWAGIVGEEDASSALGLEPRTSAVGREAT